MATLRESTVHYGEDNPPSFHAMADHLDEACWLISPGGDRIEHVNPAYERIWRQARATLLRAPRSWLDAIHPEDRSRVGRAFDAFLAATGSRIYDEQYCLALDDGATRWIHQRILPFPAQTGAPPRLLSLARDISALRQAQHAAGDSGERLLKLTQHQETLHEAQRTRIAREIHDELGQALTVLSLDLHWLAKHSPPDERILRKLAEMQQLVEHTAKAVQDITLRLRPASFGAFGLEGALNWYISRFRQQNHGLVCRQSVRLSGVKVDQDVAIALYRILQEALTNISRHARASHVTIEIVHEGQAISLLVEDDGVGIGEQELRRHDAWGLIGMRERADALGGGFAIRSEPGRGTRLSVRLPLQGGAGAPG